MSIEIPPEYQAFVDSLVSSRRYLTEKEVLAASLRLLQAKELLVDEVRLGFEQIEAGQCVDGQEAFSALRSRLSKRDQQ